MSKVRPLGDKILVKRAEPETTKEKPQQATVVAVGDGRLLDSGKRAPFQVKKGDKVIIGKWGGTELKIDGEDLLVLGEDEILAVIE